MASSSEAAPGTFPAAVMAIRASPKRQESDPIDDEERLLYKALRDRARRDGYEHIDSVLLLQMTRGYHYEEERAERTYAALSKCLAWRRSIGADSILHAPCSEVTADHAEWRAAWHMDIYGEDRDGHPIMGHRLGKLSPAAFIARFGIDAIKRNYTRDMEFLQWHKEQVSIKGTATIYKQISILDMTDLGYAHTTSEFRTPIAEVVGLLQDMYPEGTVRVYIVNTPLIFRAMWAIIKPMLHPVTQKNITILGYDQQQLNTAFRAAGMEPEQLPTWAGGQQETGLLNKWLKDGTPELWRVSEKDGPAAGAISPLRTSLNEEDRPAADLEPLVVTIEDVRTETACKYVLSVDGAGLLLASETTRDDLNLNGLYQRESFTAAEPDGGGLFGQGVASPFLILASVRLSAAGVDEGGSASLSAFKVLKVRVVFGMRKAERNQLLEWLLTRQDEDEVEEMTAEAYQMSLLKDQQGLFRGARASAGQQQRPEAPKPQLQKLALDPAELAAAAAAAAQAQAQAQAEKLRVERQAQLQTPPRQTNAAPDGNLSIAAVEALHRYYQDVDTNPGVSAMAVLAAQQQVSPRAISCWFEVKQAVEMANRLAHAIRPEPQPEPEPEPEPELDGHTTDESDDDDEFHDALEHDHEHTANFQNAVRPALAAPTLEPQRLQLEPEPEPEPDPDPESPAASVPGLPSPKNGLGSLNGAASEEELTSTIFWQLEELHSVLEVHTRPRNGNGNGNGNGHRAKMRVGELKRLLSDSSLVAAIGLGKGLTDEELDDAAKQIYLQCQQASSLSDGVSSDYGSLYGSAEGSADGSKALLRASAASLDDDADDGNGGSSAAGDFPARIPEGDDAFVDTYQVEVWWKEKVWPQQQLAAAMMTASSVTDAGHRRSLSGPV